MEQNGIMGGIYNISNWIMRLFYVNLLWLLFSIAGLVVLGFFPATTAMFAVIRKWIIEDVNIPVFKTFWEAFRAEFVQSNIIGYILLLVGYLLYINALFIKGIDNSVVTNISMFVFITILITYSIIVLYTFPILVHYKLKITDNIKVAFMIGLLSPFYTLLMISGMILVYFLIFFIPGIIQFFLGSLLALFIMVNAYRAIIKVDPKNEHNLEHLKQK